MLSLFATYSVTVATQTFSLHALSTLCTGDSFPSVICRVLYTLLSKWGIFFLGGSCSNAKLDITTAGLSWKVLGAPGYKVTYMQVRSRQKAWVTFVWLGFKCVSEPVFYWTWIGYFILSAVMCFHIILHPPPSLHQLHPSCLHIFECTSLWIMFEKTLALEISVWTTE